MRVPTYASECHPPLSGSDVVPVVELTKFVLNPSESTVGSICWEWGKSEGSNTWYLECCIEGITSTKHVTYTRFHFSDYGAPPFGDHVVWVEIGRDEQVTLDLDLLDVLLSESEFKFEHLERLDLNFAQPDPTSSPRTIASQLSHVVKMNHPTEIQIYANGAPCHRRQIPTELAMSVAHIEGTVCCRSTQNYIGTWRAGVLQSLERLSDKMNGGNAQEEVAQIEISVVKVLREVVLVDKAKYGLLSVSLNNSGHALSLLDRHEESLKYEQEALEIYRRLAKEDPARYNPDVALSLYNIGGSCSKLRRYEEALKHEQESLQIRRGLAAEDPVRFNRVLASSLNDTSHVLSKLGRHEEALKHDQEALEIRAKACHKRIQRETILTLHYPHYNHRRLHSNLRSVTREPWSMRQEALQIRRGLAAEDPVTFNPDLASSLNDTSCALSNLGRHGEALKYGQEALEIKRGLVKEDSTRYDPDLALSLHNMGTSYSQLRRYEEALKHHEEALKINRGLAAEDAEMFNPDLATSLNNIGSIFSDLGRHDEALRSHREALGILQELARQDPTQFNPDLASALHTVSADFCSLGSYENALKYDQEALEICRDLMKRDAALYDRLYSQALNLVSEALTHCGRHEEALVLTREGADMLRSHDNGQSGSFHEDLPDRLDTLSLVLSNVGETDAACPASQESVEKL
ncbi:hypothetical protein NLI96_g5032 [Meripilus lineatus]|uniref:TPR-like protein n=1 Tax=Meripilus lineatus TaxID=2056292 RepID=A0AAD5V5H2_9APHY|nr:hypothetical protein NLI96_g5032 [Physisporinus lineatus]